MGVQQGILHTDCLDESIKLVRPVAFGEGLVKRGDGVVDDLIEDRWHQQPNHDTPRSACAYLSP